MNGRTFKERELFKKKKKNQSLFVPVLFGIFRACLNKEISSLNFRHSISITHHSQLITHHSSLITQFFTLIWHHHFIFITQYFSHHLWVPHLLHCQSTSVLLLAEHFHPIKTLSFLISPSPSPSALSLSQSRNPNPNP